MWQICHYTNFIAHTVHKSLCKKFKKYLDIKQIGVNFEHVFFTLTVGPWADVKIGFTWKIIIVLKVRGGHGE